MVLTLSWTQNLFGNRIFLDPTFLYPKIFLDPKCTWNWNFTLALAQLVNSYKWIIGTKKRMTLYNATGFVYHPIQWPSSLGNKAHYHYNYYYSFTIFYSLINKLRATILGTSILECYFIYPLPYITISHLSKRIRK